MARFSRRRRRRGFTLTELLIVLAILVMLGALVVPRFFGASEKADRQATQTQIGLFRGGLEQYRVDTKTFPTTEQGLQALLTPPSDADESTVSGWAGPYLSTDALPKDPWGNLYQYEYEEGAELPKIWSWGPDKEDGTEDDICSWSSEGGGEDEFGAGGDEDLDIDIDTDFGSGGGFPEPEL